MSTVIWTPTVNFQWMKRPPPTGVTLPQGEYTMVLQQWWIASDGSPGEWRELPIRWFGEVYPNPPNA
jgi:hypothetical protein